MKVGMNKCSAQKQQLCGIRQKRRALCSHGCQEFNPQEKKRMAHVNITHYIDRTGKKDHSESQNACRVAKDEQALAASVTVPPEAKE